MHRFLKARFLLALGRARERERKKERDLEITRGK